MRVHIGTFYPDSKMYKGAEGKTVGKAIVGEDAGQIIANRRSIRGNMNESGRKAMVLVQQIVQNNVGVVPVLSFSRYAGCGMCPCSPGYKIMLDVDENKGQKIRDEFKRYGRLSYYGGKYPNRYIVKGARDCGVTFWGEEVKGKVEIRSGHYQEETDKAFEVFGEILKGKS